MPSAANALVQYEAGQDLKSMHALADSGDHTIYISGSAPLFSSRSGYAPVVNPTGVVTGGGAGHVIPAVSLTNDAVDAAAATCYLAGVLTAVAADTDITITRPATAVAKINSLTITSGGVYAMVAGTDGATTTFSAVRGAAGGPPWIPTTSIEIAQIRVTSNTSAVIAASEIFQVLGTHLERYDYPAFSVYPIGTPARTTSAYVQFGTALPLIHSDDAGTTTSSKKIYAEVYAPLFADVQVATNFVPPGVTRSVQATQYYRVSRGAVSSTLTQGSFTAAVDDGITDGLSQLSGETLTFKFFPDEDLAPHMLAQGVLTASPSYPPDGDITVECTISAQSEAVRKAS